MHRTVDLSKLSKEEYDPDKIRFSTLNQGRASVQEIISSHEFMQLNDDAEPFATVRENRVSDLNDDMVQFDPQNTYESVNDDHECPFDRPKESEESSTPQNIENAQDGSPFKTPIRQIEISIEENKIHEIGDWIIEKPQPEIIDESIISTENREISKPVIADETITCSKPLSIDENVETTQLEKVDEPVQVAELEKVEDPIKIIEHEK